MPLLCVVARQTSCDELGAVARQVVGVGARRRARRDVPSDRLPIAGREGVDKAVQVEAEGKPTGRSSPGGMEDPGEIKAQTPAEFLWLVFIPLAVGMVFVALTCLLRTKKAYEKTIYAPMLLLNENEEGTGDKHGIQYMPKGAVAWIRELFKYDENDVLKTRGADKAVFLLVEKLIIKLAVIFSVLGWAILAPIYLTSGGALQPSFDVWFNKVSLSRVEAKSSRLWASMVMCYLFSFITFWFLVNLTQKIAKIRIQSLSIGEWSIKAFSTLVRDLPSQPPEDSKETVDDAKSPSSSASKTLTFAKSLKSSLMTSSNLRREDVFRFFEAEFPEEIVQVSCVPTDTKEVEKLWIRYQKNLKKLARAKADYEISDGQGFLIWKKNAPMLDSSVPKQAKKLEEIKEKYIHYMEKTSKMKVELEKLQQEALDQPVAAAIVTFNSRKTAVLAGQSLHALDGNLWLTSPAEEPEAMVWSNLSLKKGQRYTASKLVTVVLILLIFFWMIPVFFVASLTTLSNLEKWLPFVKSLPEWFRGFLQGFLPGLALLLFNLLLLPICRFLTFMEGVPNLSMLESGTATKLFLFSVFNTFLGVTVMSSILAELDTILDGGLDFMDVIKLLGEAVPTTAIFFMNYILLQSWIGWPLDLSRVINIIVYHIKVRFLCRTVEDIKDTVAADGPLFPRAISKNLFILLVAVVFSTIHPLVPPFAALSMLVGYFVHLNDFLFVTSKNQYESDGLLWMPIMQKICWILVLAQLTLAGVLLLKESPIAAGLLVPLVFLTYGFYSYVYQRYGRAMLFVPLQIVSDLDRRSTDGVGRLENESGMADALERQSTSPEELLQRGYHMPCMRPPKPLHHEVEPPLLDAPELPETWATPPTK